MNFKNVVRKAGLPILFLLIFTGFCKAQDHEMAIGLRGGVGYGLSLKQFIEDDVAVELIFNSRYSGINITGLYEWHKEAFNNPNWYWFYGGGVHIGFWNGDNTPWGDDPGSYLSTGLDGIGGLEYEFDNYPIAISIDWKPSFNLSGYSGFIGDNGALTFRYTF